MRIVLLIADYVNQELIKKHGDLFSMFNDFFNSKKIELVPYNAYLGELPNIIEIKRANGFIITGSRNNVNQNLLWVENLIKFIQLCAIQQKKILGVCFGHQLIAKTCGAQVIARSQGMNLGTKLLKLLFGHISKINVLYNHNDEVINLPKNANILATCPYVKYPMYMINNLFLGIQFHPEYTISYQQALAEIAHCHNKISHSQLMEVYRNNIAFNKKSSDYFRDYIFNFFKGDTKNV